jgi:hypothetical protein
MTIADELVTHIITITSSSAHQESDGSSFNNNMVNVVFCIIPRSLSKKSEMIDIFIEINENKSNRCKFFAQYAAVYVVLLME